MKRLMLIAAQLTAIVLLTMSAPETAQAETAAAAAAAHPRILALHSYHPGFPSTPDYQLELRAAFGAEYDLREEFLDTKRHPREAMFALMRRSLAGKLRDWGAPDLVIAFDDNATIFAERYRDTLLAGAPLVFAGVNSRRRAQQSGEDPNTTGVHESASIKETLELAAALNPTPLKRVIGLVDDSPTSAGYQERFWPLTRQFPEISFETLSLSDYLIDDYVKAIAAIDDKSAVFVALGTFHDKSGASFETTDLYRRYVAAAKRPLYAFFERYVALGALGGVTLSHRLQAREAVRMAKRILDGESPAAIPVLMESPNVVTLNARQIERFGLRAEAIPAGARLLDARPPFWRRYRDALIGGAGAVTAMLGVLVLVTGVNRRAQKRLETINGALAASNGQLREAKASIEHNALHDALTGLPNRRYLDKTLAEKSAHTGAGFSVMQVDLDSFKQINDTLGHAAGDAVLKVIAERLKASLRGRDFVARIGGDEFIIVCDGLTDPEELQGLADRIIATTREPIECEGRSCRVGASVGIARVVQPGAAPKSLLIDVDFALYRAKSLGRNRAEFYSSELQREIVRKRELAEDIRRGFAAGEFKTYFQPQLDCRTLEIAGVEALARWEHPEKGILSPGVFLDAAESLNIVAQLDGLMLENALAAFHGWRALGIDLPRLSVNVSPKRLAQPDLPTELHRLDLPRGALSFELLESTFLDRDDPGIQWNIDRIREAGVDIEIDDFGSGHASIVGLIRLRPERLKLDRFLTSQLTESCEGVTVIRSLLEIADSLKIDAIAEGVETLEQLRLLREMGCGAVQGYLIAKPMSEAAFADWICALPQRAAEMNHALEQAAGDAPRAAALR